MLVAYCRRRGSHDPEGIAAETISIAWAQREKLDLNKCRPWLLTTARNLLYDEYRARNRVVPMEPEAIARIDSRQVPDYEVESHNPNLSRALTTLSPEDREAILLVAWEELTPANAAKSMGLRPATFRVRLHRARGRLKKALEESGASQVGATELTPEESA